MNANDFAEFVEVWNVAQEMMPFGKSFSNAAMKVSFKLLAQYPIEHVTTAIYKHIETSDRAPQPSDIIKIITKGTGGEHYEPAEAWGRFPKEVHESGIVSVEMFKAWDVAEDLYQRKQYFAAEKAFLAAYTREVSESNMLGMIPKWQLSKGTNEAQLKAVIQEALKRGQLTHEYAQSVLDSLLPPAFGVVAGLISGNVPEGVQGLTEIAKSNISQIIKMFNETDEKIKLERKQAHEDEIKRRDDMVNATMMELLKEQQLALRSANLERHGIEVLH
jgi:hypothetical protein